MSITFSTWALLGANLLVALALGRLWLTDTFALQQFVWVPPAAVTPALDAVPQANAAATQSKVYMAMLERPLFAPDRRAPPPPDLAPPPPPPDPLADVRLLGLLSGDEWSGAILVQSGRVRRLSVGQSLGDWTLSSIEQRNATFSRGEETRVLVLVKQKTPPTIAPRASAATGGAAAPATADPFDENRARMQRLQDLLKQQNR